MLWYIIGFLCLASVIGVSAKAKGKSWQVPLSAVMAILAVVCAVNGYRSLNVSAGTIDARQAGYAEVGGKGLALELAKRFPGKKWLVVLPAKGSGQCEQIYSGFQQALKANPATVMEVPFVLGDADLKKLAMGVSGDAGLAATPDVLLANSAVSEMLTASMFQSALAAKLKDADVVIGFAGMPRGKEIKALCQLLKGKTLVLVNGDCSLLEAEIRSGQVVGLLAFSADPELLAKKVPGSQEKAFAAFWRLATMESVDALKADGIFATGE
jgi:hypothetical protein